MRRRTVLLGACGLALAGCGQAAGTTAVSRQSSSQPLPSTGSTRVADWALHGGLLPLGISRLSPPRLAVFADGAAVTDCRRILTLGRDELWEQVAALRRDLTGIPPTVPPPQAGQTVIDAATTQIGVLDVDGGLRRVQAYALDLLDGYPQQLRAANDRLSTLAERIRATGSAYTADRVRIIAMSRPDTNTVIRWPATVPVPAIVDRGRAAVEDIRMADLAGPAARTAVADLPPKAQQPNGEWPILHTLSDDNLAVAWRYLLPDE